MTIELTEAERNKILLFLEDEENSDGWRWSFEERCELLEKIRAIVKACNPPPRATWEQISKFAIDTYAASGNVSDADYADWLRSFGVEVVKEEK